MQLLDLLHYNQQSKSGLYKHCGTRIS